MKYRFWKLFLYGIVFAAIFSVLVPPVFANIVIICNKSVSVDKLKREEVRDIFLGKQKRWPDNKRVEVVVLGDYDVHSYFVQKFTAKTPLQFRTYWRQMLFTGKGIVPKTLPDEKSVMNYVKKTEGAVGYVSTTILENSSLKILSIINAGESSQ